MVGGLCWSGLGSYRISKGVVQVMNEQCPRLLLHLRGREAAIETTNAWVAREK